MARTKRPKYYRHLKLDHRNLHDLFARHQKVLKSLKFGKALKYFENYASAQFDHMEKEESSIFPFLKEDLKLPSLALLLKEHRKVSEALILIRVLLHKSVDPKGRGKTERSLWKAENAYTKLIQSHERKEEKYFFPRIEKKLKKIA